MMKGFCVVVAFGLLVACGSDPSEPTESRGYECRMCGDYDALDAAMELQAGDAECTLAPGGSVDTIDGCTVGEEDFSFSTYHFERCSKPPACATPSEGGGGAGGATGDGDAPWEYRCSFCGDESDAAAVYYGGYEEAGCSSSKASDDPVLDCASGETGWSIAFSHCVSAPECTP